jgi:uncharacterized OB-fold protein
MIIPLPTHVEREVSDDVLDYRWIREYWFDAVDWKCAVCGSVMFGRMTYCVYCRAHGKGEKQ